MQPNNLQWLDYSHEVIHLPRLHPSFDGYRMVQLSDIHFGTWIDRQRLASVVERINEQNPDCIAITGDFVSRNPKRYAAELTAVLRDLAPKDVTVAVLGNHDHWSDSEVVGRILEELGIMHLQNTSYSLHRNAGMLHLAGVDCTYTKMDRLDIVLKGLPDDGAAILLAHEPDFADTSAATGRFDLQISGHSHGGQINLPLIGTPILPLHGRKYPRGRYQINGMVQYTNRGVGTSHFQLRYNCPAEVTEFTLRGEVNSDIRRAQWCSRQEFIPPPSASPEFQSIVFEQ